MSDPTIEQFGSGVTRVTHGAPTGPQSVQAWESTKVHTGTLRHNFGEGADSEPSGQYAHHQTHGQPLAPGAGVMATAKRDANGHSVELVPGIPATRTRIEVAVREGLVKQGPGGEWIDSAPAGQQADLAQGSPSNEEQGAEPTDPGRGTFDHDDDQSWAAAIDPLPQHAYDASVSRGIEAAIQGHSMDAVGLELAKSVGMPEALGAEYVEAGSAMFQRAVDRDMAKQGISGENLQAFYAWARQPQNVPALRDGLQKLVLGRDPSGFRSLANQWTMANKQGRT